MRRSRTAWSTALGVAATALALGACSDSATIVEPSKPVPMAHVGVPQTDIISGVLTYSISNTLITTPLPGDVAICKTGTDASFQITIRPHLYGPNGEVLTDPATGGAALGTALSGWNGNTVNLTNGTCIVFHAYSTNEFTVTATEQVSATSAFQGLTAVTINDAPGAVATACDLDTGTPATDLERCSTSGMTVTFEELNVHHGGLATFVNQPLGTLRLCKIAGTGVSVGTQFSFLITVDGAPFEPLPLAAGTSTASGSANCIEGPIEFGQVFTIQELNVAANMTVTINGGTVTDATHTTTVTGNGTLQVVTFTNSIESQPLGCTLTQGYWKNHPDAWPVSQLTLGTVTYTKAQLLDILNAPVKGNGLISLAHQLIAAKLNIASGANATTISASITAADAMIGSLVVPPIGNGFLSTSATSTLTGALDTFNNGQTQGGPPHCGD